MTVPAVHAPARRLVKGLPAVFAIITVLGQIIWVLVPSGDRAPLTALTVVAFFLAGATHAWLHRGPRWTVLAFGCAMVVGWLAEAIGTRTGWPFGDYAYSPTLGPQLLGVPVLIPMAWAMMAYPSLLAAQRLTRARWAVALIGGALVAAWDLFLDPQMVSEGYWTWQQIGATLPGIDEIPLQNFLGWLLVAVILMGLLSLLPRIEAPDQVPSLLLGWIYASNVLAAGVFFGRPAVALWGGVCMGAVIVPWALTWRRSATSRQASC